MGMGQEVGTGLGHGGITCAIQFSSLSKYQVKTSIIQSRISKIHFVMK